MKAKLLKKFEEIYGNSEDAKVYFAPGRVNLIGEHTDYTVQALRDFFASHLFCCPG